jgi:hypothetical protein
VEIFADNPVVAQTASIIGSRDLHRALHIDHYVNNTAHIPLRCNESFLDGALRIAQELLNGLRAKMRPRHVAAPDWMIGNFSIHQHTYVYLPNSPIPGHDTGHGWYPIETLIKRQHGLD